MSDILTSTPRADGYGMPAEWAAQARCWMMWPTRPDTWRAAAAPAQATFATVANAIAEFEPVVIGVDAAHYRHARQLLSAAVDLQLIDSNDAWMRDIGPTFVRNGENKLRAVDWVFNAWGGFDGGLYQPWDADSRRRRGRRRRSGRASGRACRRAALSRTAGAGRRRHSCRW